jgi:hypothetical protein
VWGTLQEKEKYRSSPCEELEHLQIQWFQQMRTENFPINGPVLQEKATGIALKLKAENFKALNGWPHQFKKRHNIRICVVRVEVSTDILKHCKESVPELTQGYEPNNIFNSDETGLFYNLLPSKTFSMEGEPCHGDKKRSKECFTMLLCCDSDGSKKLKPLVIGKYEKPRYFKNISSLPCKYVSNNKAWIASCIFINFLKVFNVRMGAAGTKVLLFVSVQPTHQIHDF